MNTGSTYTGSDVRNTVRDTARDITQVPTTTTYTTTDASTDASNLWESAKDKLLVAKDVVAEKLAGATESVKDTLGMNKTVSTTTVEARDAQVPFTQGGSYTVTDARNAVMRQNVLEDHPEVPAEMLYSKEAVNEAVKNYNGSALTGEATQSGVTGIWESAKEKIADAAEVVKGTLGVESARDDAQVPSTFGGSFTVTDARNAVMRSNVKEDHPEVPAEMLYAKQAVNEAVKNHAEHETGAATQASSAASNLWESAKDKLAVAKDVVVEKLSEAQHSAAVKLADAQHSAAIKLAEVKHTAGEKLGDVQHAAAVKYADARDAAGEKLADAQHSAAIKLADVHHAAAVKYADARDAAGEKLADMKVAATETLVHAKEAVKDSVGLNKTSEDTVDAEEDIPKGPSAMTVDELFAANRAHDSTAINYTAPSYNITESVQAAELAVKAATKDLANTVSKLEEDGVIDSQSSEIQDAKDTVKGATHDADKQKIVSQ